MFERMHRFFVAYLPAGAGVASRQSFAYYATEEEANKAANLHLNINSTMVHIGEMRPLYELRRPDPIRISFQPTGKE